MRALSRVFSTLRARAILIAGDRQQVLLLSRGSGSRLDHFVDDSVFLREALYLAVGFVGYENRNDRFSEGVIVLEQELIAFEAAEGVELRIEAKLDQEHIGVAFDNRVGSFLSVADPAEELVGVVALGELVGQAEADIEVECAGAGFDRWIPALPDGKVLGAHSWRVAGEVGLVAVSEDGRHGNTYCCEFGFAFSIVILIVGPLVSVVVGFQPIDFSTRVIWSIANCSASVAIFVDSYERELLEGSFLAAHFAGVHERRNRRIWVDAWRRGLGGLLLWGGGHVAVGDGL